MSGSRNKALKVKAVCDDRPFVIPNGFNLERFVPDPRARTEVREEIGVPHGTPLIGMVARFDPQKDHENFFKAAALLKNHLPDVQYILCGTGVLPDNRAIQSWIDEGGLNGRCHLLGYRSDVPRIMAALDLVATSSSYGEAFPMVVGEAMACGVPCVVTDVGDSAHMVGDTGRRVPVRDPAALAGAWRDILNTDESSKRRLSEAARARIMKLYSLNSVTEQYESLYRNLLQ